MDDLLRDLVIGWVVIKEIYESFEGPKTLIDVKPLVVNWEGTIEPPVTLAEDEKILAIVPAIPGTYEIWASPDGGEAYKKLGYELPGGFHPDWNEVLAELIKKERGKS